MAIGCCVRTGKTVFILINILYFIQGINLLVLGAAVKINIIPVDVLSVLNTLQIFGVGLGNFFNIVYILVVVTGSFVIISAIVGISGVLLESRCLMTEYLISLVVMLCALITIAVLWFNIKDMFTVETKILLLKTIMRNTITESLKSVSDVIFTGLDPSSLTFGCCGLDSVADSEKSFEHTPWCLLSSDCQRAYLPETCCRGPKVLNIEILSSATCPISEKIKTFDVEGCFDHLEELFQMYFKSTFGNALGVIFTQVVEAVLGFFVFKRFRPVALPV